MAAPRPLCGNSPCDLPLYPSARLIPSLAPGSSSGKSPSTPHTSRLLLPLWPDCSRGFSFRVGREAHAGDIDGTAGQCHLRPGPRGEGSPLLGVLPRAGDGQCVSGCDQMCVLRERTPQGWAGRTPSRSCVYRSSLQAEASMLRLSFQKSVGPLGLCFLNLKTGECV